MAEISICTWQKEWEEWLQESGRSSKTIKAYVQDVRVFARWFESQGEVFFPGDLSSIDLRAWREYSLGVEQVSPATWNRRRATMRVYAEFCKQRYGMRSDPLRGVQEAEEAELAPRWLEMRDLGRFLRQVEMVCNGASTLAWRRQALRDAAIIGLMVWAGLRENEVASLDLNDVELRERSGRVIIRRGKGDKRREVPLGAEVRRALGEWIAVRGQAPGALFFGKGTGRISTRLIQRRVAEIGRLAGVEVTPHMLRHTFAKRVLDKGGQLTVVQRLLGHARLETTARYVQPGWSDLARAVE